MCNRDKNYKSFNLKLHEKPNVSGKQQWKKSPSLQEIKELWGKVRVEISNTLWKRGTDVLMELEKYWLTLSCHHTLGVSTWSKCFGSKLVSTTSTFSVFSNLQRGARVRHILTLSWRASMTLRLVSGTPPLGKQSGVILLLVIHLLIGKSVALERA